MNTFCVTVWRNWAEHDHRKALFVDPLVGKYCVDTLPTVCRPLVEFYSSSLCVDTLAFLLGSDSTITSIESAGLMLCDFT